MTQYVFLLHSIYNHTLCSFAYFISLLPDKCSAKKCNVPVPFKPFFFSEMALNFLCLIFLIDVLATLKMPELQKALRIQSQVSSLVNASS